MTKEKQAELEALIEGPYPDLDRLDSAVLAFIVLNNITHDFYEIVYGPKLLSKYFPGNFSKRQMSLSLGRLRVKGSLNYGAFKMPCDWDYETQTCTCEHHLPCWGYKLSATEKEKHQC